MIEANEDITLVTERQLHDVEEGQAQATAIAEGREAHPAELAAQLQSTVSAGNPSDTPVQTQIEVRQPDGPPPDPDTAMRHLRISIVAVMALVLFLVWLRQRKSGK